MFAQNVYFTYKGKKAFTTMLGGCCSIVLVLAFLSFFISDAYHLSTSPEYTSSTSTTFARYSSNTEPFFMDTTEQTVAIAVQSLFRTQDEINKNFRV